MKNLFRSFWFATAVVVYVAFASLEVSSQHSLTWLLLLGAPVVLWLTWRYTGANQNVLEPEHLVLADAQRAVVTGTLLFFCARTGPLGHPGFDAAANLGVGVTLVAACTALARITGRGQLLTSPRATRSLDAAVMAAMLWGLTTTLPAIRNLLPNSFLALDPLAIDYATVTAGMASLLLLLATTARLHHLRRLEFEVSDRATSTLIVSVVALFATVPALLLDVVAPDRAVPFVVVLASLFHVWAASSIDARKITASLRVSLAILAFLAPIVLLLALLARRSPSLAPMLIVGCSSLSVVLGLVASRLARPLAPEQSRWLDAIEVASEAALVPDPSDALRATLVALNPTAPGHNSRVELWRIDPPTVLYVDVAGQLHEEAALVPQSVITLAEREPERTLRSDVLQAVLVRNTQAREAFAYLETRNTYTATLLTSETEPIGLLAFPKSHRKSPLSLEECVAMRRLCDRLESVLAITSAQARTRQRELLALAKVTELKDENQRLSTILSSTGTLHQRFVERYSQRLRPQLYSPNARNAQFELTRLAKNCREITLRLPPGSDALAWASLFHLASPRLLGPFVSFDGTSPDFDKEPWDDPKRSPLAIAETGTFILLNPQALTNKQQETLAASMVHAKATQVIESVPPMGFVLAVHSIDEAPLDELPITEALRTLFPPSNTVDVPSLSARPEDLRATVYERAARLGTTLRGTALGIAPAALVEMLEYDWPLNDLELENTLMTLAVVSEGNVITVEDLETIGFTSHTSHPRLGPNASNAEPTKRQKPRVRSRMTRPLDR